MAHQTRDDGLLASLPSVTLEREPFSGLVPTSSQRSRCTMRAFISSLLIVPIAVTALLTGCSAGGQDGDELQDSGGTSNRGGTGTGPGTGGTGNTGTGGRPPIIEMMDGGTVDPCEVAGLPADCETVAQPGCGDQIVQDGGLCDDEQLPGDCAWLRRSRSTASADGEACRSTSICGYGIAARVKRATDGMPWAATVAPPTATWRKRRRARSRAWRHPAYVCGEGRQDANEAATRHKLSATAAADAAASNRFQVRGKGSTCSPYCGDCARGRRELRRRQYVPSTAARPIARGADVREGEACSAQCGDGIVFGDEQCDDGNLRNGDGCSDACAQEEGYMCNNDAPCTKRPGVDPTTGQMGEVCALAVPAIFRDFNGRTATSSPHPTFAGREITAP